MRLVSTILLSIVTFFVIGCGSTTGNHSIIMENSNNTAPTAQPGTSSSKNIALVMKTLTNPFFIEMEKGARKAAKELGINLTVKTGAQETSITQQIAIIEDLIHDKVDGIVIAPASSTELIPVLKKAQDAKIAIINIDNQLDVEMCRKIGLVDIPFISVNNEQGGYLSAQYISEKITQPTEVAILEGITSAKNSQDRKNGALRAFNENPNVKVVAIETANWKIDEAYTVTDNLYKRFPTIGAFFCANDMMALGTAKYLSEDMKYSKVLIGAYDALEETKNEIKDGKITVTIDQQADVQGYLGVKYVLQEINGETIPAETLVDLKVVHTGNLK